jgi:plastocyanin
MGHTRYWAFAISAVLLAGCTPGAPAAPTASNEHVATAVNVGISLLKYGQMSSVYGMVGGYNPALVIVAHGTTVQFHNEDSFNNTATFISGAAFPGGNPIPTSALTQSGTDVAKPGWSSGLLTGGAFSQALGTSAIGQYLFGCFYHYPTMRGVIIVQ